MGQLTAEHLEKLLRAAESLEELRKESGLDVSISASRAVGDYTACISDPETLRPPMIVYHFKDGTIMARAGRERAENDCESISELFNSQNRREA